MTHKNNFVPKAYLKLHKIGRKYMLVESSDSCVNLTNVYSLNETAAWLWKRICEGEGHSLEELAESMCETYNVDYGRAIHDVERQLEEWKKMGLL